MKPLRVHIENSTRVADMFSVDDAKWQAALHRHPWATDRIDVTMGKDFESGSAGLRDAEILIATQIPTGEFRTVAPKVRWIQTKGGGIDHLLPLDWLTDDVILTNCSGIHSEIAGQYALWAILAINLSVPFLMTRQRHNEWQQRFATSVVGKVLVVLGVGRLGGAVAREAKRLGLKVFGIRRSGGKHDFVDTMFRPEDLPAVLPKADFLLIAAPLTSETRNLIGARELDLMKPSAGLINMGRAQIVDYTALGARLRNGRLGGAVLDVFDHEPLAPTEEIWGIPNLILTPHISSDDADRYIDLALDVFFDNLACYMSGQPLANVVDKTREY